MRLSRLRIVSAAVLPLVLLAGCSDSKPAAKTAAKPAPPKPVCSPAKTAGPADPLSKSVTMGGTAKAPTLSLQTKPLTVQETTTKVVTAGKGAKVVPANPVIFNVAWYNGKDGKQILNTFGKKPEGLDLAANMPGLCKGLTGQKLGSRVVIAVPPADAFGAQGNPQAGVGPTDTTLFIVDLVSDVKPLSTATGTAVAPKAGLPTATVDGAKPATITVPKTTAPTGLVVQPLITGAGPVVKAGQSIKVNYTGVLWKDGKKFDASGDHGGPFSTLIGPGASIIPAWSKGLVGKTVGSRILLVVPPADGYGAAGSPPKIGPKDTLVFVVDILAAF